ncbi:MAG: NAD-dependent succinate-semialdehyde dehydrogenase [Cellvibrionaceae bacterium]
MLTLNDPTLLHDKNYVNGRWIESGINKKIDVLNPATGELIVSVADGSVGDIREAVRSADIAMDEWSKCTAKHRARILKTWFDLIILHKDDLACIMTAEQGKPLVESKSEISYGASYIEWFAEEAKRIYGDVIPSHGEDKRLLTIKQPVGVVAAITPWNFPCAMITRKAAPALAAGCSIVIKPAAETPLSALALAELASRAGIPNGVLNVVVGSNSVDIGKELTLNETVRKVTFTGSTRVGKILLRQCADTVKKTSMELGGNAAFIIFDDADLDKAVEGLMSAKFRNAGQTCVCANRILVHESVYDSFSEKFTESVKKLLVGNGFDEGVSIGPLIDQKAHENMLSLVNDAKGLGAEVIAGGKPSELGGNFFEPTVIKNATPEMRVFKEEIFGPIAPIFKFSSDQEVIEMANCTEYGLAAYLYTSDIKRIFSVSESLEFGIVGVNEGIISTEVAPFGGVKESGSGREGSKYGIEDYVELKYICIGGL